MITNLLLLYSANLVICSTNQHKAILSGLILFIILAINLFTYGLEFLSLIFLIIYVGALTILFIFAIMLSD